MRIVQDQYAGVNRGSGTPSGFAAMRGRIVRDGIGSSVEDRADYSDVTRGILCSLRTPDGSPMEHGVAMVRQAVVAESMYACATIDGEFRRNPGAHISGSRLMEPFLMLSGGASEFDFLSSVLAVRFMMHGYMNPVMGARSGDDYPTAAYSSMVSRVTDAIRNEYGIDCARIDAPRMAFTDRTIPCFDFDGMDLDRLVLRGCTIADGASFKGTHIAHLVLEDEASLVGAEFDDATRVDEVSASDGVTLSWDTYEALSRMCGYDVALGKDAAQDAAQAVSSMPSLDDLRERARQTSRDMGRVGIDDFPSPLDEDGKQAPDTDFGE